MIPIPVETDAMLAILNLPKEMSNNGIFKEHQGLVLEIIHSLVLQEHYDRATHDDLPEDDPLLISFRFGFSFLMLYSTAELSQFEDSGRGHSQDCRFRPICHRTAHRQRNRRLQS